MHHERMARAPLHAYLLTHRQERLSVPREHVHHPTPSLAAHDAKCIARQPLCAVYAAGAKVDFHDVQ